MKRIHKLETEDHGRYEYYWIICRDPEKFQEPDNRNYDASPYWGNVTCKRCLAKYDGFKDFGTGPTKIWKGHANA